MGTVLLMLLTGRLPGSLPQRATLLKFEVKSITGGTDALGEVSVTVEEDGKTVRGHGADTNIIIAAARAYLNALNKLAARKK